MNVSVAFHEGDKEQVQRWLDWVSELGGMGRHKLWLMPVKGLAADFKTDIPFSLIEDGSGVRTDWSKTNDAVRDAAGANSMIRQMCWHFFLGKLGAFFWCEPDAIPLREGWHDAIEDEYNRERKHWMGALVPGKPGDYPDHSTGIAVYSQNTVELSKLMMLPTHAKIEGSERNVELAFDVAAAPDLLRNFHNTKLIQHVFRGPRFTHQSELARIHPDAVIWHSDKDGGLCRLLRERRAGVVTVETQHELAAAFGCSQSNIHYIVSRKTWNPHEKPKVHTYFRPCVDADALEEQKRILAIWEANWRKAGWEPVILTEAHARNHPEFEKYRAAFEAMPTVNPPAYEQAAWLRHVAMAALASPHAEILVDYDTLCNGFTMPKHDLSEYFPTILSDNNPVPCAVIGTSSQWDDAIRTFLTCPIGTEQGQPHLSDQLAVQTLKFPAMDICREVGVAGWRDAKLIHFSHAACGKRRSQDMTGWINDRYSERDPKKEPVTKVDAIMKRPIMDEIRERLVWIKENSRGITRHHVHRELKALGLLPKK